MSGFVRHSSATSGSFAKPLKGVKSGQYGDCLSTGIPSLDNIFGDGLNMGSLLIVEEDWPRSSVNQASLILKAFLAEGLHQDHPSILISKDYSKDEIFTNLPVYSEDANTEETGKAEDKMKIAWRYKHLVSEDVKAPIKKGQYDFGRKTDLSIARKIVNFADNTDLFEDESAKYKRIAILGFGSPFWQESTLVQTMLKLRKYVQERQAVAVISIPSYCMPLDTLIALRHLSSAVIALDTLSARPFKQHADAFLKIIQPASPSFLKPHVPECTVLAVKWKRRRMMIEPFYLPPELEGESSSMSCAAPSTQSELF